MSEVPLHLDNTGSWSLPIVDFDAQGDFDVQVSGLKPWGFGSRVGGWQTRHPKSGFGDWTVISHNASITWFHKVNLPTKTSAYCFNQ